MAALAAITTSQEAETAADEELFKPQQLEAKKKAVAIVRPQPQQPTQLQQPSQPKPSELKFPFKKTIPHEYRTLLFFTFFAMNFKNMTSLKMNLRPNKHQLI